MSETKSPIDQNFLSEVSGGDLSIEKEIFDTFFESCNKLLTQMEQAMKSGDANDWHLCAHSLKGASGSVGAFDLSNLFGYAQEHPKETLEQKQEVLKKIKAELGLVTEFTKTKK